MSDGTFCAHSIVRSVPHIDPVGNRSDHWRCECGQVFEPIPGGPDLIDEIIEASSPGFDALVDAATARRTAGRGSLWQGDPCAEGTADGMAAALSGLRDEGVSLRVYIAELDARLARIEATLSLWVTMWR